MIYTELTVKAMKIAYAAHHNQFDCNGVPYIFHPYHMAEQMNDEYTTCVALLHDVVEDTAVTFEQLESEFPEEVIEALKLLTHEDGTDYFEYIARIKPNPIAKAVKLADLAHNMDRSRIINPDIIPPEKFASWDYKYSRALKILTDC